MEFDSSSFACFAIIVGFLFLIFSRFHSSVYQNSTLLAASYFFYGSWDYRFLFLIIFSTALDYSCGMGIAGERISIRRSLFFTLTLVCSACLLCSPFDYSAFYQSLLPAEAFTGGWISISNLNSNSPSHVDLMFAASLCVSILLGAFQQVGGKLSSDGRRRFFLALSICGNLGILGVFKYFDFFVGSLATALNAVGIAVPEWHLGIIVPVGISFYTFQTLSYTIDIYRGDLKPTHSLLNFALFVAYFPQLVAGPIERARVLLPQLEQVRKPKLIDLKAGSFLIYWGLFKKIFIADNLADLVNVAYAANHQPTGPEVLLATYAFAFQIYADFSAYSDIARGISRCMGVELMVNFNIPFAAKSASDFWRRWHISLSTWLRDYLYIPLGGNRGNQVFIFRNLMITMTLGGIWHGARVNFLLWGIYQGLLLCAYRWMQTPLQNLADKAKLPRALQTTIAWVTFFHLMCYGWLLFRCDSLSQISLLSSAIFTGWSSSPNASGSLFRLIWFCGLLVIVQIFQFRSKNLLVPLTWKWYTQVFFFMLTFYLTIIFGAFEEIDFIYFQF